MIIIIPCFNEFNRLNKKAFLAFLATHPTVKIIFSDDASTDQTLILLKEIQNNFSNQVFICTLSKNQGKAAAVRNAVLFAFEQKISFDKIAYLDADLSVSLEECLSLFEYVNNKKIVVFGSRICKIDNTIIRSNFRHYSGRFVATIISNLLKIKVYDTQCGCKIFDAKLAKIIFNEPFISRWLFDVELFFRIIQQYSREEMRNITAEIPLKSWIDEGGSKLKITYFFKMWKDLYFIKKKYQDV